MIRAKAFIAMTVAFVLCLMAFAGVVKAEDDLKQVWVLCQPDSFVNIRERPNKRGTQVGYAECGDSFRTDGKKKSGFLHVYASVESGEGWISTGYIVWTEPVQVYEIRQIESNGRVKARKTIGGKRRCWLKNGDEIRVYWIADWAVTNKGFVKADYISQEGEKYDPADD